MWSSHLMSLPPLIHNIHTTIFSTSLFPLNTSFFISLYLTPSVAFPINERVVFQKRCQIYIFKNLYTNFLCILSFPPDSHSPNCLSFKFWINLKLIRFRTAIALSDFKSAIAETTTSKFPPRLYLVEILILLLLWIIVHIYPYSFWYFIRLKCLK